MLESGSAMLESGSAMLESGSATWRAKRTRGRTQNMFRQ
jgi:hypothetical protein